VGVKRVVNPSTNPAGLGAAAAAIYAAVVMIYHAVHHVGVIDPQVLVAALGAAVFVYTRFKVTPVKDPKDGNGTPLLTVPQATLYVTPPPGVAPAPPADPTRL
jgi:hypothetical protein